MRKFPSPSTALAWLLASLTFLLPTAVQAIQIDLQFDTGSFFGGDPTARATIEQAAADLSAAITTSNLSAIDTYSWDRSQTFQNSNILSAEYTWSFSYNPIGQPVVTIPSTGLAANTVQLFIGEGLFTGQTLATGGPAGIGFTVQYQLSPAVSVNNSQLQTAFDQLTETQEGLAESEFRRGGGGPTIGTIAGTATLNFAEIPPSPNATSPYAVALGPTYGALAIDVDTDNDGTKNNATQLREFWHLDYQTPVPADKQDLYSVALHEMLHTLGLGSSDDWETLVSGDNWLGSEVLATHGTGNDVVDGSHIQSGTVSRRIADSLPQEVALAPTLEKGNRRSLTALDLAFLRDIGWETILPPTPLDGDYNFDGVVDAADYTLWRDTLGSRTQLAADGDLSLRVTQADYGVWKANYGATTGAGLVTVGLQGNVVPEPSTAVLFLCVSWTIWFASKTHRRLRGHQSRR